MANKYGWLFLVIISFLSTTQIVSAEEFALIVNHRNAYLDNLSQMRNKVKKIFLKQNKKWPHNIGKVKRYCRGSNSSEQRAFNQFVLKMPMAKLKKYWITRKQRFGDSPPQEIKSSRVVMRLVAKSKGAFAVVKKTDLKKLPKNLRVLFMFSSTGRLYAYQKPVIIKPKKKVWTKPNPAPIIKNKVEEYKAVILHLEQPVKGYKTKNKRLKVKGFISGNWEKGTFKLNNKLIYIDKYGRFNTFLKINSGDTKLNLEVEDILGKKIRLSRWVSRTRTHRKITEKPIILSIQEPKQDTKTSESTLFLEAKVSGGNGPLAVFINQYRIKPNRQGQFTHQLKIKMGFNQFIINVKDKNGHKIQRELNIKRVAPKALKIILTQGNYLVSDEHKIMVKGRIEGGKGTRLLKIDGQAVTINKKGQFHATVMVKQGERKILIKVKDQTGKIAQAFIRIVGV